MTEGTGAARWGMEIVATLADGRPRSVDQLAAQARARRGELLAFLQEHPHLLETSSGWVNAVRLADGVAFTHELSALERQVHVLAADDDLALWAALAGAGLPLAAGGEVRAHPLPELPAEVLTNLPAGGGMIGQGLVGPSGWLTGFQAGDLLQVRLCDGALEVRAGMSVQDAPQRVAGLLAACTAALGQALLRYTQGEGEIPAADISAVLADLLLTRPEVLTDGPLAPLGSRLRRAGYESFGGHVGLVGTPWNLTRIKDLSRTDAIGASSALALLLTWDAAHPDSDRTVELLKQALTLPETVKYLADEVERRTATAGTSFDGVLQRLAAIAGTPTERAAVALLAARAAEGTGDSGAAQELIGRALADRPDLQPALRDASEYAACRGDLRVAEAHLRRVQHPMVATLHSAVRSVLNVPVSGTQPGRNRPCPCGSGRKFKVCCHPPVVGPLAARAGLLYTLVSLFAQRELSGDLLGLLINRSGSDLQNALLCVDLLLAHEGFTERFLRARGTMLRDDERTLIETWATVPIGAFEIRDVRRGMGVTVRVLPAGPVIELRDRKFSTCTHRLDLFCGRLLSDGTQPQVLAPPVLVPRDRRRDLLDLLASSPSSVQIAQFLGPQPQPVLQNVDGHEYLDAEVTLDLTDADRAWQRLSTRLVLTDSDTLDYQDERADKTVSLGQVTRTGQRWTLNANSHERLAILESLVRSEAPAAQQVSARADRVGGEPPRDGRKVRTLLVDSYLIPAGPDPRYTHQDQIRSYAQSWVDTPIDLGMTPREAAQAGGNTRAELEAILDDMQWHNERNEHNNRYGRPATMDVAWIRRQLGISV